GGPGEAALGPGSLADPLLAWYCSVKYLIPVEGGLYWMNRRLRDRVYTENSTHTKAEDITAGFTGKLKNDLKTLAQLLLLSLHHDRIARYYYHQTYVMSKDPQAFFEYVYHRVSSIRYLAKLALALAWSSDSDHV